MDFKKNIIDALHEDGQEALIGVKKEFMFSNLADLSTDGFSMRQNDYTADEKAAFITNFRNAYISKISTLDIYRVDDENYDAVVDFIYDVLKDIN